jgi:hypothetical protein
MEEHNNKLTIKLLRECIMSVAAPKASSAESDATFLYQALRNLTSKDKSLGIVQKSIMDKVSNALFLVKAIPDYWDYKARPSKCYTYTDQLFTVKFYYDFQDSQIKCAVSVEIVTKEKLAEKIQEKIQDFEFLLVEPLKKNWADYYVSAGKLTLTCNESANSTLKQVVMSALTVLNEKK